MRNPFVTLVSAVALFAVLLGTNGCSMLTSAALPDASVNPEQASVGTIQGSNFGGHAPLVGAHVYLLQPGTSGYGSQATSLLSATTSGNGYPTSENSSGADPGIPTNWYYETTDSTGAFNLTGDYTCTVGLPVYLYLYGGSPTFPSNSNVFSATQVTVDTLTYLGVNGTAEYTISPTTTENFYVGEKVVLSGYPTSILGATGIGVAINGTQTVLATNLSTNSFSFAAGTYLLETAGTQTVSGTITAEPTFNPAVVNLAVLGNCPSGGFTGANAISYVYVNEVATTAAAYAFQPFTLPTNNSAIDIGTTSTNIAGIQNAAVIAKQLYDITGSNVSTTYAGEGHIARSMTPAGNGIVPQANLDTLGNILAQCVDSNNGATTVGATGTTNSAGAYTGISPQCNTLFQNATNTGIPTTSTGTGANAAGTQPFDTAMAAINIARHPAGPPYSYSSTGSSTFMSNLYTLPTGNPPFAPNLVSTGAGQPNDFTIGIVYTAANNPGSAGGSYTTGIESVAIDKIGNVWATSPNTGTPPYYFYEMSPAGVVSNVNTQNSWQYGTVVVDSGESAWAGSATSANPVSYVHATNTPSAAVGSAPVTYTYNAGATNSTLNENYSYASVADNAGNVYFGNNQTGSSLNDYIETFTGAATTPTVTGTESAVLSGVTTAAPISFISGEIGVGGTSAFFNYDAYQTGRVTITSVNLATGATDTGFPVYGDNSGSSTGATPGCTSLLNGDKLAVTRSNDIIVPDFHNQTGSLNAATDSLYYINKGTGTPGTCAQISAATLQAGLYSPWAEAVDGNDYVYIVNRSGNNVSVVNTQSGTAAGTVAVSPSTGYSPQYVNGSTLTTMLDQPFGIAIGPSGEIWIPSPFNNSLVEIIGLAAPTTTPLSVASGNGGIGNKP